MKRLLATLSFTVCAFAAQAQTAPADDSAYHAFGGQPGLVRLMDDFMVRLIADPRTGPFFKDVDQRDLKAKLVSQFCVVSGGPCKYTGADMKTAHNGIDIRKGDFNALVEVLQRSMDAQGVPFRQQNRLLAVLAPMHRDVINTH